MVDRRQRHALDHRAARALDAVVQVAALIGSRWRTAQPVRLAEERDRAEPRDGRASRSPRSRSRCAASPRRSRSRTSRRSRRASSCSTRGRAAPSSCSSRSPLFQVVLAANLTDSVLLHAPARRLPLSRGLDAARAHAAQRGARGGRSPRAAARHHARPAAHDAVRLGALGAARAALFVTLPRLRSSVITGSGASALLATRGLLARVELGDLGRIRQDPTVVLRVETLEGARSGARRGLLARARLRPFDGRSWSITPPHRSPVAGSAEGGVRFGREPERVNLVQRIVREPVDSGRALRRRRAARAAGHGAPARARRERRPLRGGQAHERMRYTFSSYQRTWRDRICVATPRPPSRATRSATSQLPELSPAVGVARAPHHGERPRTTPSAPARSRASWPARAATRTRPLPSTRTRPARRSRRSCSASSPATASTSPRRWWCSPARSACPRGS